VIIDYHGVIDILDGDFPLFDCGGDVDVLRSIRRLREGTILGIRGRERGGMTSS
jgi:hypothetical protein